MLQWSFILLRARRTEKIKNIECKNDLFLATSYLDLYIDYYALLFSGGGRAEGGGGGMNLWWIGKNIWCGGSLLGGFLLVGVGEWANVWLVGDYPHSIPLVGKILTSDTCWQDHGNYLPFKNNYLVVKNSDKTNLQSNYSIITKILLTMFKRMK